MDSRRYRLAWHKVSRYMRFNPLQYRCRTSCYGLEKTKQSHGLSQVREPTWLGGRVIEIFSVPQSGSGQSHSMLASLSLELVTHNRPPLSIPYWNITSGN